MSLQRIKSEIFQELEALFALAATDELAGDMEGYKVKLQTISSIADLLGISTEITEVSINLKTDDGK